MPTNTKKYIVQEMHRAGMSRRDIISGMKSVFESRYDESRLKRDLKGFEGRIDRHSYYLENLKDIKAISSPAFFKDYMAAKPENMVKGYLIKYELDRNSRVVHSMKDEPLNWLNEFFIAGGEGSP